MAQYISETVFDIIYLIGVIVLGFIMFTGAGTNPLVKKYGLMAMILGGGDSFHLIPRIFAMWTTGFEANAIPLGLGKLVTSITMTVFYMMLYYIWRERYQIRGRNTLTAAMWGLAIVRIILCLLPQNDWLNYKQPLFFGVLRNIPFVVIGLFIIVLFAQEARKNKDTVFKFMPLAVILSFGFYIPVVLFSGVMPIIGILMIPKTISYVWIVLMGWQLYKQPAEAIT